MYAYPTLSSEIGDNKGSCSTYAEYLLKEVGNDNFWNHSNNEIKLSEGVDLIDSNSKLRLKTSDAKWFAPLYSFSEDECIHVCKILFDKDYTDYDQLNEEEKNTYNNYFKDIGKELQNEMARNFGKEDLNIIDGSNLFYLGVVENRRKYKHNDEDVKNGIVKEGDYKRGFNTHIHIIQSRLANNGKHSKISPMSKAKNQFNSNLQGKIGFDRMTFAKNCEVKFDEFTSYIRNTKDTLEAKINNQKVINERLKNEFNINFKTNDNLNNIITSTKTIYSNSYKKYVEKSFDINDYLNYLLSIKKIKYNAEKDIFLFGKKEIKKLGKTKCLISPDKTIDLFYLFWMIEKLNYNQSVSKINYLKQLNKQLDLINSSNKKNYNFEVIEEKKNIDRDYLKTNLIKSDIIISEIPNDVVQLKLKNKKTNRFFFSLAFKNLDGSYTLFNDKYQSSLNKNIDSFVFKKGTTNNFKMFENVNDYLRFINLNKLSDDDSIIILNGIHNLNSVSKFINESSFNKGKCFLKSNSFNFIGSFSNLSFENLSNEVNDFEKYSKKNRVDIMKENSLNYIDNFYKKK